MFKRTFSTYKQQFVCRLLQQPQLRCDAGCEPHSQQRLKVFLCSDLALNFHVWVYCILDRHINKPIFGICLLSA